MPAGINKIFSMIPDENYKVLDVLVDGSSKWPVPSYHFDNVSSNHIIQTSFTVDFDVKNNNTVVPKENFTVNATVLGSAFTRDIWKNDSWVEGYWEEHWETVPFPITCRLKIGNYTDDPWGNYTNGIGRESQ
ncbi:MAG TPA: hypothetical protein VN414_14055 [Methanosarcina sp.]|nr:hypothetical protein [Methanosarcina sp.]